MFIRLKGRKISTLWTEDGQRKLQFYFKHIRYLKEFRKTQIRYQLPVRFFFLVVFFTGYSRFYFSVISVNQVNIYYQETGFERVIRSPV